MFSKNELRAVMKEKRRSYPQKHRDENSEKIAKFIFGLEQFKAAACVCVYMSAFGEVSTKEIIDRCRALGKKIAVPVTDKETNTLTLSYTDGEFIKGGYGIPEPKIYKKCDFSEPELIIVPGICFDRCGARIGFGKGYYDKFLSAARGCKVGICYDFQLLEEIPSEHHDIRMDAVISEKGVIWCKDV